MIAIVNRTESVQGEEYGKGTQLYSLQINNKVLCYFTHVYEEGLATCLDRAAEAARAYQIEENESK